MNLDAVLLVSFGGPEKMEDVRPFLENVVRGHSIPQNRLDMVVEQYRAIGGSSPLNKITFDQAHALEKLLSLKVYVGMRNWTPTILEAFEQMSTQGVSRVLVFILAAHRCEASFQRYQKAIEESINKMKGKPPRIIYPEPWHTQPLFIEALCGRIEQSMSLMESLSDSCFWIFTAHSIPLSMDRESGYSRQVLETVGLVAEKFEKKSWTVAYQSRSGRPEDPWLEPDVGEKIRELSGKGIRQGLVIPVGFISDHVEVLYDLDIKARKEAHLCGFKFIRSQGLNDHPKFIEMLAQIVSDSLSPPFLKGE